MQFFSIVVLLSLFIPSLYAKNYVKLINYGSKNKVLSLGKKLDRLGFHVVIKRKSNHYYSLYIGPYEEYAQALSQQKRLKRYFPNSKILSFNSKQRKVVHNSSLIQEEKENTLIKRKTFWSSSLHIGYSSFPSTHIIEEGTISIKQPKTDGLSQSLGLNYLWSHNLLVGVNVMRMSSSDLIFTNSYLSIDYKFEKITQEYFPYFGVIGGYSLLKWNIDPVGNSETSNNDSQSFFYGTHVGIIHPLSPIWDFVIDYQCIFMNHTTNLTKKDTTDKSKLQHNISNTLQIGLQYHF